MVTLYVEGGGDHEIECRKGFRIFLEKAGIKGRMPRIFACGTRNEALNDFTEGLNRGETAFLLVDSEAPVSLEHQNGDPADWRPWDHLKDRDAWTKPDKIAALSTGVELHAKQKIETTLKDATKDCVPKGAYGKGAHSFKILAELSPSKVIAASPWAKRFIDEMKKITA